MIRILTAWILSCGLALANPPGTFNPILFNQPSLTTWDPANSTVGCTFSNGNLKVIGTCTFGGFATTGTNSKIYYEVLLGGTLGTNERIGMADSSWNKSTQELGDGTHSISYTPTNGQVRYNGAGIATIMISASGDTISVAWDTINHKIWFRKNGGLWNNTTDDPSTNVGGYSNFTSSGNAFPAYELFNGTAPFWTAGFSASSWLYSIPSGFSPMP